MLYLVRYSGPFGFLKPWTAVRDELTFSQQFLTPSVIEGIEKKLFPELLVQSSYERRIVRHRLTYAGISRQQEQTQPRGISKKTSRRSGIVEVSRPRSILTRGTLIEPILHLAFGTAEDALRATTQHICLCRNEDVLLPDSELTEIEESDFDDPAKGYIGFELRFGKHKDSFLVGFNRFRNNEPMYGWLHIVGSNPLTSSVIA